MRRYFSIILSFMVIGIAGYIVINKKNENSVNETCNKEQVNNVGTFGTQRMCARAPKFLQKLNISQPVIIDLSQKRFKGIALLYGKDFKKVLHPKQWEQYEHFSTYTVDEKGNIYLVPTPFISIRPTTFNLQKNIYRLDSNTGKLSIFMHFDDISPSPNNPYGINAITYDCEDKTLWIAAIDESDYQSQKGVIYHVDIQSKKILQTVEGFDVLTMQIIKSQKGKYLLVGSARDNALYMYAVKNGQAAEVPEKLLELSSMNEHIRKIKIKKRNQLELQAIPFSYALIAQTAKKDRIYYNAVWDSTIKKWSVQKVN